MTRETRTLIELSDITGLEFECRKCGAKILYPFQKPYQRLVEYCPSCNETWIENPGMRNPAAPTSAEEIKNILVRLKAIADSPMVKAHVRVAVNIDSEKELG